MAVEFIRKQAKLNRVTSRLHIVQAAVSDQVGWQPMVAVGVLSGGYYVPPSEDHTAGELTSTRTTTLDRLVQKFGLQPTHVKIDVEGYEFGVISGGHKILSQDDAPILFVELHNEMVRQNGGLPEKTLSLLRNLGYQIFGTNGDPLDDQAILDWPLIRVVARKMPVPAGVAGPPIPIKSVNSE